MHADMQGSDDERVELAVEVFAMLADATRVRIVLALAEGEQSVGELAAAVDKAPTAVSQHLAKLRLARMVRTRQQGTRVIYSLADDHARQLVADAMHQGEHAIGSIPAHEGASDTRQAPVRRLGGTDA